MRSTPRTCGFTLEPAFIDELYGEPDFFLRSFEGTDLERWYLTTRAACCNRPAWRESGYCVWHARTEDKPVAALLETMGPAPVNVDGAYLRGLDLGGRISFADCSLVAVDFSGSDLRGANFAEANLAYTNFWECDLEGADFTDAAIFGTVFPAPPTPPGREAATGVESAPEGEASDDGAVAADADGMAGLRSLLGRLLGAESEGEESLFERAESRFDECARGVDPERNCAEAAALYRQARETELDPDSEDFPTSSTASFPSSGDMRS